MNIFGFKIDSQFLDFFKEAWRLTIISVDGKSVTLGSLVVGILFLIVGVIISRILSRRLSSVLEKRLDVDRNARHMFESLSFYILLVFATLFSLKVANIPITVFTVIGGALAIGVGFGSQNLINNFISGIILMVERPIKVGDFVEIEGIFGEVENIGMRSTSVLSYGNKHIIVPNSSFLEKNVLNWTHKNKLIRTSIDVGVSYGSPTRRVAELLKKSVSEEAEVVLEREPIVFFTQFGDNALNFRVEFWIVIKNLDNRRTIESNIRFRIDEFFKEAGVTIAFPQRDIHLDQKKPFEVLVKQST